MSLEQAIQELTKNIVEQNIILRENAAKNEKTDLLYEKMIALYEGLSSKTPMAEIGDKPEKKPEPEKKPDPKKLTAETASPAKGATPPASEKVDSASENEVDYETVKVPFLLWAAKDKPAAKALLEKVGAKNLTSATAEQRKAIFKAIPKADEDLS